MYVTGVEPGDGPDGRRDRGRTARPRLEFTRPDGGHPGWSVLVGPNQAGKTTLLDEIARAARGEPNTHGYAVAWSRGSRPLCLHYRDRLPAYEDSDAASAAGDPDPELLSGLDPSQDARIAAFAVELWRALGRRGADRESPAVVLIDDVEAHLPPVWQRRIGPWLTHRFPAAQFIVATHSPYVCQAADPGGLIRLLGPHAHYAAEVVGEELYHRVVYGSADDIALSELFGVESAYSERAEAVRAELVALEHEIVRGRASADEEERHRELSRLLTSSTSTRADEIAVRRLRRRRDQP